MTKNLDTILNGNEYCQEIVIGEICINVFFHEDHQKYEIELSRKNGEEGEQPLPIIISNDYEEGKNPELAKIFFTLATELAKEGKSIGEIYHELEEHINDDYKEKAMVILANEMKNNVEEVVDLNSKNLEELKKYIGQKYPDKKLIYDIYLGSIPHYNPIDDEEKRNYILELLKRNLTLGEKLAVKFKEKYNDVDNVPTNYLLFLNSIIELGETGDISDKERKAQFFIFIFYKNIKYNFSDKKSNDLFYTNFSNVIKEFFEQGYFNTKDSYQGIRLDRSNNKSDYRGKELALVEEGIGNNNTTYEQFKELLNEKYKEFVNQTFSLVAIERADIVLQKLGKQDIPKHSPIFGAIVQLLQGKNFEDISMGGFEELEGGNLKNFMEKAGIPTTRKGLEEILVGGGLHKKEILAVEGKQKTRLPRKEKKGKKGK